MRDNGYLKQLGSKVKSVRMSKGLTVRALGEMCEIDYSNYSRFESGRKNIRILTLLNIANKLDVDVKKFL